MNNFKACAAEQIRKNTVPIAIYLCCFLLFIGKATFYMDNVGRFPDESMHIAYVVYLENTSKIVPDFREIYHHVTPKNPNELSEAAIDTSALNYLGHPPLYYHIMRLSHAVQLREDGALLVNIRGLRQFSLCIASIGVLLAMYIGITRLKGALQHLVYATVLVSVPMLAYDSAGVNNDALSIVGVTLVFLALIRLAEQRRGQMTFWLLGVGVAISVLSKLTAGLVVAAACAAFFLHCIIKERSLSILFNRQFLLTLPLYCVAAGYFAYIYARYGTVQPSLKVLDYEYFLTTGFYVPESKRIALTFGQYAKRYFAGFFATWTGIASHVSLLKNASPFSERRVALMVLWVFPFFTFFSRGQYSRQKRGAQALFFGVALAALVQFYRAWNGFLANGYLGGYQSRYYLCAAPALAFLAAAFWGERHAYIKQCAQKSQFASIAAAGYAALIVAYCALLYYEDFIYFLLKFDNYL